MFNRSTRLGLTAGLLGLTIALTAAGPATANSAACGPRRDLVGQLAGKYKEAPVAVGLAQDGTLVEVLAASGGATWTMIVSRPDGISCLVAAGESWQLLSTMVAEGPDV